MRRNTATYKKDQLLPHVHLTNNHLEKFKVIFPFFGSH